MVRGEWGRPRQSRGVRGSRPRVEVHHPHRRLVCERGRVAGVRSGRAPARACIHWLVGAILNARFPQPEVLMAHRNIKIVVTAVVLASAFGFMMWTTLRDGAEYFKHVDEVIAQRTSLEGKKLQVQGYVIPGSILVKPNTLEYRFRIQNNPI